MGVQNQIRREWGHGTLEGQIGGERFYPNLHSGLQQNFGPHHKICIYSLYSCIGGLGKHGDPSNGRENHISQWQA
jgi:hypothetical protein